MANRQPPEEPVNPGPSPRARQSNNPKLDATAQERLSRVAGTTPKAAATPRGQTTPGAADDALTQRINALLARERTKLEAARIRAEATKHRADVISASRTATAQQKRDAQAEHDHAERLKQNAKKRLAKLQTEGRAALLKQRADQRQQEQQQRQAAQGRTAASDKGELPDYIRANGRMSVARRTAVIAPALERLGYAPDQARSIALDAPLSAGMTDQQALLAALRYAKTLTTPTALSAALGGATPLTQRGQSLNGQQGVIQMPDAAATALQQAEESESPVIKRFGKQSGIGSVYTRLSRIARLLNTRADSVANVPTPSGILGLLTINLLLLFFAVPANAQGYTRAALFWLTLLNRTKLPETIPVDAIPADPLVAAVTGAAVNLGNLAGSVATLGQNAANVVGAIQNPGGAVASAITKAASGVSGPLEPALGGFLTGLEGTLLPGVGGGPPLHSIGGGPPPPPMPPPFPHGVPLQ